MLIKDEIATYLRASWQKISTIQSKNVHFKNYNCELLHFVFLFVLYGRKELKKKKKRYIFCENYNISGEIKIVQIYNLKVTSN